MYKRTRRAVYQCCCAGCPGNRLQLPGCAETGAAAVPVPGRAAVGSAAAVWLHRKSATWSDRGQHMVNAWSIHGQDLTITLFHHFNRLHQHVTMIITIGSGPTNHTSLPVIVKTQLPNGHTLARSNPLACHIPQGCKVPLRPPLMGLKLPTTRWMAAHSAVQALCETVSCVGVVLKREERHYRPSVQVAVRDVRPRGCQR